MSQSTGKEFILAAFTEKEWRRVPSEIARKLESYIGEKIDDLITARARVETQSYNAVHTLSELQSKYESVSKEHESLGKKMESAGSTITELENQLSNSVADVNRLQNTCNRLEVEVSDLRNSRNKLTDERDELNRMVDRRNAEVERMQTDMNSLTKQLEEAIAAKCEILAKVHEVESMKLSIEYKEKRMEQERALLNSQMKDLTDDLEKRTEELLNMRRDNYSRCVQLEIKVTEKSHELIAANESIKMLTETNSGLMAKNDEILEKWSNEKEAFAKQMETFEQELNAQKKIADLYKGVGDEKATHANELTEAFQELKGKLDETLEKYGDLETKHKEDSLAHEEILDKKNQCIAMLKRELEVANQIRANSENDSLQREVEEMSPSAAAASRLMKPGMTLTEIYKQYVSVSESLVHEQNENERLQAYIQSVVQEVNDKFPQVIKHREDLERANEKIAEMAKEKDAMFYEMQQIRDTNIDLQRIEVTATRENHRLKQDLKDLGRQVCHLLREVDHSRVGSSTTSTTDQDLSDSTCSADIISKRLVTFADISELQATNQRLLSLVRELSSKQEENEMMSPEMIENLKMQLDSMRESNADLLQQQEKQTSMFKMLTEQRDTYKTLYHQFLKGNVDDSMDLDKTSSSAKNNDDAEHNDAKLKEVEAILEKVKKELQLTKDEFDTYRNEKAANEKIVLEQSERMRKETQEMMRQNTKLSAKVETCDEMLKVHRKNTEVYKNQIERLEERNKIYSESIVKHETAQSYLKDQILDAQTKLSKAEVMLGNLQKENALLREAENRLMRERDTLQREHQSNTIMQTNIELIKATLERNDAEGRIRLEETIKEANRESSALRRRLHEEVDRFRQMREHMEQQLETSKNRIAEQQACEEKLRNELMATREELAGKSQQLEDLSKKLKNSILHDIEGTVEARKYRELEHLLQITQSEVETLKQKLSINKDAVEQHSNVAEAAEKQLIDLMDKHKNDCVEFNAKLSEKEAKIVSLEELCAELQGEISLQTDGQVTVTSDLHKKLSKCELQFKNVSEELEKAKEQLEEAKNLRETILTTENKYIEEVTAHSNDLLILRQTKELLKQFESRENETRHERDRANEALEEERCSWLKQEEFYKKQQLELEERFKSLTEHNQALHNQFEDLNSRISIMQTQISDSHNRSMGDINRSFTEDEVKSSEQLLRIIKYLRHEKDIAVNKCEILEAENSRIKAQYENVKKQLDDAKQAYEAERQKSEVSVITAAKHSEVLRRVETLNAITDSNRSLRIERDGLLAELNELKLRTTTMENQLSPLQEKNKELQNKAEAMQTENITLRGEATRWRQRANMLIEKSNRTSPEDWKKLQNERENLAKQLTIERANTTKLAEENNNLQKDKTKLTEHVKELMQQQAVQKEEMERLAAQIESLGTQVTSLTHNVDQTQANLIKMTEENRVLTETLAEKDVSLNDVKINLAQIRKIAKKYKIQAEEQGKELQLYREKTTNASTSVSEEKREEILQEGRAELEERMSKIEQTHNEHITQLTQQISSTSEENEKNKKEIDTLKNDLQVSLEKEERFKVLFKNAKERILKLTDQNNSLMGQINKDDGSSSSKSDGAQQSTTHASDVERLEKEKQDVMQEKQEEKERFLKEIETLTQRINQLQRQLGSQQGSKPSTSSEKEKTVTEPPTANIKPMAGHSTNTQTQSVPIQPWRSGSEPPLASIRPMSMQLRTVAVLPTSQSPSTVMVPPQQQVHTTGSSAAEAMSSSPTSSHTDYVPATSSASSAMLGPRQVAVPPTQSNQDTEDEENNVQVQQTPQQQAVALILPRIEPPSSAQEQGTSSSSSNTVTTSQASHKRPREADTESQHEEREKTAQLAKRTRVSQTGAESVSESGLEVEYQVPTSSQRDHEEDAVIVVESDEEGPDEGEGEDYNMTYEDPDTQDPDQDDEGGNEVEVIEDSSEVPNQSERGVESDMQADGEEEEECEAPEEGEEEETMQPEATSSGTNVSTSVAVTLPSFSRTRQVTPLLRQQQGHLIIQHVMEEGGDDGIVPSTPTLFVTRRDAFGEAVSSPHVPTSGRFTFTESGAPSNIGCNDVLPEQTLEIANDDNSTGRSVPSTPLQTSPHESGPSNEDQAMKQGGEGDNSTISESGAEDEAEPAELGDCSMGPPSLAGTSGESSQPMIDQGEEMQEGDDRVSSEGEKTTATEEGEEEGREAEASPSTNTRSRNLRSASGIARRTPRQSNVRGISRSGPTPIVWSGDQQQTSRPQEGVPRGRGNPGFTRALSRRSRGRNQRGAYAGRF